MEWKQASNPIDSGTITGSEIVRADLARSGFEFTGLGLSNVNRTLLDGNGTGVNWYFSIGCTDQHTDPNIPGAYGLSAIREDAEVWIKVEPFLEKYLEKMTLSKSGDLQIAGELKETNTLNTIGTENQTTLDLRDVNNII